MHQTSRCASILLLLVAIGAAEPSLGQSADDAGPGFVRRWAADAKSYATSPLHADRRQWVGFASTVAAIGVAYQHDEDVRAHFVPEDSVGTGTHDSYDLEDALPGALALGGTWLAARLVDSDDGRREAGTMLEAAVFSTFASSLLKEAAGRERPHVNSDHSAFGEGGPSFPSVHVSAAFAIGSVMAESGNDRLRWVRRVLGYGIGVATAYQRVNHDEHWFSDTVAGAGIGIATARFMMKRHDQDNGRAFLVAPIADGVQVRFIAALRR